MNNLFILTATFFLSLFSLNINAQTKIDAEQLKSEINKNRSFIEQFIEPETLDKAIESIEDEDLNALLKQIESMDFGDLLNFDQLEEVAKDSFDLNEILKMDFSDLLNFIMPQEKQPEETKKIKM